MSDNDTHRSKRVACSLILAIAASLAAQVPDQNVPLSAVSPAAGTTSARHKLHPVLLQRLAEEAGPVKAWVFFTDKGVQSQDALREALRQVADSYDLRAVQRRALRGNNAARGGACSTSTTCRWFRRTWTPSPRAAPSCTLRAAG